MNKYLYFSAGLIVGAVGGAFSTWKIINEKCERKVQEEIESVKEAFSRNDKIIVMNGYSSDTQEIAEKAKNKPDISSFFNFNADTIDENGNVDYTSYYKGGKEEEIKEIKTDKPYVIKPDDFGTLDDYEITNLVYYSDNILANDLDNVEENIDEVIGKESLNHFGEYEDDMLFVRNDKLKCDYEIVLDTRTYSEVVGEMEE